ncbi:MAG: hypothetical protein P1T08_03510 [Acidimicrobiia bacterium]|nr:hypothetical protein [Acidimicrobiia bacterium]
MKPNLPAQLRQAVTGWDRLSRWERSELGRAVRRLGWSYGEIMELIPVPKGTLAYWCRDIRLPEQQVLDIASRTSSRRGVPRDTQRKRRAATELVRSSARLEVPTLVGDQLWLAGTVMYWAEGAKAKRQLDLANSDPRAHRLFIAWVRTHLNSDPIFVLHLHLHHGNDEPLAREFWKIALGLPDVQFHRTFIKPARTGHRKNHLAHGVLRVRVRRSTDAWFRVMGWIDGLADELAVSDEEGSGAILSPGR